LACSAGELGFRSELIFHRFAGRVDDLRAEHGCVRVLTPGNPSFFWGNFLLFEQAPTSDDVLRWPALFERLITAVQPASAHRAFGWLDDAPGQIEPFLRAGYEAVDSAVMSANSLLPAPPPRAAALLRRFEGDDDWRRLIDLHVGTREADHPESVYRAFATARAAQWRAMQAAGLGAWFGAFVAEGGRESLASALGIFVETPSGLADTRDRIARYQVVVTVKAHRRAGLARALIVEAARYAREHLGAARFVIIAAADEMPERLYSSLGFERMGLWRGLQKVGYASLTSGSA
jgi:GNAT superfamily N-acetyltransferase